MVQIIKLLEKTSFSFLSISHLTAIYTEDTLLSQSRIVLHPRHLHPKPVCLTTAIPTNRQPLEPTPVPTVSPTAVPRDTPMTQPTLVPTAAP